MATTPAVVAGVAFALYITHTTLNIQSFMGAIMAIGVAVANAILLVTFAEKARQTGIGAAEGARTGAEERLRPILMTSCAMIAGMVPMALGLGEGGEQSAPLGRAVIGGLSVATGATLLILPAVFTIVMGSSKIGSVSLHPDDEDGAYYAPDDADADGAHGHAGPDSHGTSAQSEARMIVPSPTPGVVTTAPPPRPRPPVGGLGATDIPYADLHSEESPPQPGHEGPDSTDPDNRPTPPPANS